MIRGGMAVTVARLAARSSRGVGAVVGEENGLEEAVVPTRGLL